MNIPITQTKVVVPRRRNELLTRQRLIDLLYELLDYRLIVLTAPAGYGKTSLLIDFAKHTDLPVCWFSIDGFDQNPQRFIAHFIAAISQRFPSFGDQSRAAVASSNQANIDLGWLVTAITNDAYENIREHFLLVLDDYHLVNDNKDIDYFINRFVQVVDENCHLIISSRSLLYLQDMPLIVARSQVAGLGFEELAFKAEEIKALLFQNNRITLSDSTAEEMIKETEGWITGLLLSTQTATPGMMDRLRVARVSGVGLYDYLAQQVLDRQLPEVRDFLLKTSFLEEFNVEQCEAVFGPGEDYSRLLVTVLQNNLFVLPVDDEGGWIRYHHLFRDFLQSRLEQENPELRVSILKRLGEVYKERAEWEKAYATYKRLGDLALILDLIEFAGSSLLASGRLMLLVDWIDTLPADVLAGRPKLLSLKGVVAVIQGKMEYGLSMLNRAEERFNLPEDETSYALTLVRRAMTYRFLGKYQDSLQDAGKALEMSAHIPNSISLQAEALRAIGMSLYQMGDVTEATEKLNLSLVLFREANDRQNEAMVLMELGLAYMSTGRYQQSLHYYEEGLEYWREMHNRIREATLQNNLGVLHHLMGNYERAASHFEEGLSHAKQSGYARMESYILCGLGDLYSDLGATNAALDAYQRAKIIAQQIDYRFLLLYINLAEAAQSRRKNNFEQAHEFSKTAERLVKESNSRYESALWHIEVGHLSNAEGKHVEAIQQYKLATECFVEGGHRVEASRAYLYLAAAYYKSGDKQLAYLHLANAFQIASELESQHILVVAGRDLEPLLESSKEDIILKANSSILIKQVNTFEENIPAFRRRLRPHTSSVPFAPPKLSIYALGRSQVELDGTPVAVAEWQNQRRVREFFFYLLSHPVGLTKEEIGLEFWKDSSSAQLKLQFKNTIYRLRHALGQDVISFNEDRYWFNRNLDYEYDVESFLRYLSQAKEAATTSETISFYKAAIDQYKGIFLPDIDGTWVTLEREKLWKLNVEAALNVARIYLERGEYNQTIDYCQWILEKDDCLEEAHRLAMLAYAGKGNRAEVKRQYERCQKALLEEVNTQPSPQTSDLYESLRM